MNIKPKKRQPRINGRGRYMQGFSLSAEDRKLLTILVGRLQSAGEQADASSVIRELIQAEYERQAEVK